MVLAAGLFLAATTPGMTHAAAATGDTPTPSALAGSALVGALTPISQPFAVAGEAGLGNWVIGSSGPSPVVPSIVEVGPTGWLAITPGPIPSVPGPDPLAGATQTGYAILNEPVAGAGLTVDFTYADTGSGGLSVFLVDGSVAAPVAAASGDGLGYALASGPAGAGTALGLVGVGLDESGAFSLPDAASPASGPGQEPGSVVLRGSGDGGQGFPYLGGQVLAGTVGVPSGAAVDGLPEAGGGRRVQLAVGAGGLTVSMDFGSGWVPVLGPLATPALPASGLVKVGFAAVSASPVSTNGGEHAIRDVVIGNLAAPAPPTVTPTGAPTTGAPTTVAPSTVAPSTAAPTTLKPTTPSASSLETSVGARSVVASTSAPAQLSRRSGEATGLHSIGRAVSPAQVSSGQISVSAVVPTTAPGSPADAAVTITNISTSKLTGPVTAIIRPPDGVTLRPGATIPIGCAAVSPELLNCTITAAQLLPGSSAVLSIPFVVASTAPGGTALPNGAVIISVGSSSAAQSPFALNMTTSGSTVVVTVPASMTTTVAGAVSAVTSTTVPGSLAFTGAPAGSTANWGLLLIGAGVVLVLLSLGRRPRRDVLTGPTPG